MKRFDCNLWTLIVVVIMAVILVLFWRCDKVFVVKDFDVYTISKGQHESNERHPAYINSPFLTVQFTPDETWYYENDTHWNKLAGISTNKIHENSIRIAWRCTNGEIRIAVYEYRDGERVITPLGYVSKWDSVIIEMTENRVMFRERFYEVGNHEAKGWLCFPYFGGTSPAPHDIIFHVNFIHR